MCKSGEGYFCPFQLSIIFKTFSFKVKTVFPQRKFFNTFVRPSVVWGNVVVFFFLEIFSMRPWHPPVSLCAYYLFETLIRLLWASPVVCSDIFRYHLRALFCQNGWASELLSLNGVNSPAIFLSLMIIIINPPNLVSASRLWKMSRGM